ncbi:MAG: DHH family phosphoesterase [Chloroflexota bacterium]
MNWSELGALLGRSRRVLLMAHVSPDGDTVGSTLGLAWALRARRLEARVACAEPLPSDLLFLPGSGEFSARGLDGEDLVLAIDASDPARLGNLYDGLARAGVPVVNMDHHATNTRFGTLNLVGERAATAELALEAILALDLPLTAPAAQCLLTGLVSDTRGFRITDTTADTLRAAARLVEAGASLVQVNDALFNRVPPATLGVWGAALAQAQLDDGLLWTYLSHEVLSRAPGESSITKNLTNFLSTIDEARCAALFKELGDGVIDVSLRSRPGLDVSGIALALGGGGHARAAGCLVPGTLVDVQAQVLAMLRMEMRRMAMLRPSMQSSADPAELGQA